MPNALRLQLESVTCRIFQIATCKYTQLKTMLSKQHGETADRMARYCTSRPCWPNQTSCNPLRLIWLGSRNAYETSYMATLEIQCAKAHFIPIRTFCFAEPICLKLLGRDYLTEKKHAKIWQDSSALLWQQYICLSCCIREDANEPSVAGSKYCHENPLLCSSICYWDISAPAIASNCN